MSDTALISNLRQRIRELEDRVSELENFLHESDLVPQPFDGPTGHARDVLNLLLARKIINTERACIVLGISRSTFHVAMWRVRHFLRYKYNIEIGCQRTEGYFLLADDKQKIRDDFAESKARLTNAMRPIETPAP